MASPLLAEALRRLGATVILVTDVFERGTTDDPILARVGQEGWIFVSRDDRTRKRETERVAIAENRVGAVILEGGDLTRQQMISAFTLGFRKLVRAIEGERRPFILRLGKSGAVRKLEFKTKN